MAIPLAPVIGALLRGASSSAGTMLRSGAMAARTAATTASQSMSNARGAGRALLVARAVRTGPAPPQWETYDRGRLSRRLGVANPNEDQEADERRRIGQVNRENYPQEQRQRMAMIATTARVGAQFAGMATAAGLATTAVARLGEAMNATRVSQLRIFNASIAALAAKQEGFQMGHMVRTSAMVQGTTVSLGEELMKLKQNTEPYKAMGENITNALTEAFAHLANTLISILQSTGIDSMIRNINDWFNGGPPAPGEGGMDWLEAAKRGGLIIGNDADNLRPDEERSGARAGGGF